MTDQEFWAAAYLKLLETQSRTAARKNADAALADFKQVFSDSQPELVPLYRLQGHGDHFYTCSAEERDSAIANYGYTYEGIACYVKAP